MIKEPEDEAFEALEKSLAHPPNLQAELDATDRQVEILNDALAECEAENKLLRARNERLEKELSALRDQAPLLVDQGCAERGCMGHDHRSGDAPVMFVKLESK
jgi:septal ring factor EnvC (AmiA/AmiB activator)